MPHHTLVKHLTCIKHYKVNNIMIIGHGVHCAPCHGPLCPYPGAQWAKILLTLYFKYVPNAKRYEAVLFT